jgi:hypothetical protein
MVWQGVVMDLGRAVGPKGSGYRRFGVCLALLSVPACSSSDSYPGPAPDPDRGAEVQARAEEVAELAAIEERERAALQLERDLALAASVNGREPPGLLSHEEFETVLEWHCGACHNHGIVSPGIDDITPPFETVEELIKFRRLIPGDAASSRVVLRMQAGEMPPVMARRPPVQPAILELVVDFIDSLPPLAAPED